jgi:hypothetical protein
MYSFGSKSFSVTFFMDIANSLSNSRQAMADQLQSAEVRTANQHSVMPEDSKVIVQPQT